MAGKGKPGYERRPLEERFWERVDRRGDDECWPWVGSVSKGYGYICRGGRNGPVVGAHSLALELSQGFPVPKGMCACHHCDNPICVNPKHLFMGTFADNMADKVAKGRQGRPKNMKGEGNTRAKLTNEKVLRALSLRKSGLTYKQVAEEIGIGRSCIANVLSGLSWTHVTNIQKGSGW